MNIKKIIFVILTLSILQVIQAQFDCKCNCCVGSVDCEPELLGNFNIEDCSACGDVCRENFEECPAEGVTGNMVASCTNAEEPEPVEDEEPEPVEDEEPEPEPEPVEDEEPEPEPVEDEEPEPVEDQEPEPVSSEPIAGNDELTLLVTVFSDSACESTVQKFTIPPDGSCTRIVYEDGSEHYVRGACPSSDSPEFEYCGTSPGCDAASCTRIEAASESCSPGFDAFPYAIYDCAPLIESSALKLSFSLISLILISIFVLN